MLTPEQIPAEAVEAARKFMRLQALSDEWIDDLLAVAINAWPGIKLTPYWEHMTHKRRVEMILPLTENADG